MQRSTRIIGRERRHARIRARVFGTAERPRLSVFRSHKYLYAQLIDDVRGVTIASAHDRELEQKSKVVPVVRAERIGELIATKAKAKKINQVVFDRGGYRYAGRVRSLAEGARRGGLQF